MYRTAGDRPLHPSTSFPIAGRYYAQLPWTFPGWELGLWSHPVRPAHETCCSPASDILSDECSTPCGFSKVLWQGAIRTPYLPTYVPRYLRTELVPSYHVPSHFDAGSYRKGLHFPDANNLILLNPPSSRSSPDQIPTSLSASRRNTISSSSAFFSTVPSYVDGILPDFHRTTVPPPNVSLRLDHEKEPHASGID
jgi:hypothetical protein